MRGAKTAIHVRRGNWDCVAHSSTSQKGGNARFERETLFQQSMTLQPIQTPFELLSRTEVPQSVRASERACAVARLAPYQRGRENATCLYNVVFLHFARTNVSTYMQAVVGPTEAGRLPHFVFSSAGRWGLSRLLDFLSGCNVRGPVTVLAIKIPPPEEQTVINQR